MKLRSLVEEFAFRGVFSFPPWGKMTRGKKEGFREAKFLSFPIPVLLNCCTNASTKGSPLILRAGTQSDPNIYSIPTSIMITNSDSLLRRERGAQSIISVIYFTPCAISSLPHVRTELAHCW